MLIVIGATSLRQESPFRKNSILRQIWRKVFADVNSHTHIMDLQIPINLAEEIYYETCSEVYYHNRRRCDDLKLTKNWGTNSLD